MYAGAVIIPARAGEAPRSSGARISDRCNKYAKPATWPKGGENNDNHNDERRSHL